MRKKSGENIISCGCYILKYGKFLSFRIINYTKVYKTSDTIFVFLIKHFVNEILEFNKHKFMQIIPLNALLSFDALHARYMFRRRHNLKRTLDSAQMGHGDD